MRVTSDFFVSQLIRRVFADGTYAAVIRKGAEAAGAIYIIARQRDGTISLLAPAVQTYADRDGERRFMRETQLDDQALELRLAKEAKFDPDFWLVELETATPEIYVTLVAE